jgi:hypothetical protein
MVKVYTRSEWGSVVPPGGNLMPTRDAEAYIHHFNSGIQSPTTLSESMSRVRAAQQYHISLGWNDIGYSWLVDNMGNVFEGRGWNRTGAHTYGWNSKGYGICWLGDSNVSRPTDEALAAISWIIKTGPQGQGARYELLWRRYVWATRRDSCFGGGTRA